MSTEVISEPSPSSNTDGKKESEAEPLCDESDTDENTSITKRSVEKIPLHKNDSKGNSKQSLASSALIYQSQDIKPIDGCVVLGKDDIEGKQYTTRFRIDATSERKVAKGLVVADCCPCFQEESRGTACQWITALVTSEAFLLTFHLGALTLGVAKSSIDREEINKDIELIHSIVEILVVTFVLLARCILISNSYKDLKGSRKARQYIDMLQAHSTVGKHIRRNIHLFYVFCVFLDLIVITISVMFFFVLHLGWTTLLNNAVLILATVVSNLLLKKILRIKAAIVEDEHKVVLYEASLLLNEGSFPMNETERLSYNRKVVRYLKALMGTKSFQQPNHIELMEKYGPRWNTVTTMQVVSGV